MCLLASCMEIGLFDTGNFYDGFSDVKRYNFESVVSSSKNSFYRYVMKAIVDMGISNFFHYKFILIVAFALELTYILRKIPCNYYLLLLGYILGPFIDDAIQIRNTISLGLFLCTYAILFSKIQHKKIICVILMLIACMNHLTFIVFIPILIMSLHGEKKWINICLTTGLILYFFIFLTHRIPFESYINFFIGDTYYVGYLAHMSNYGSIPYFMLYVMFLVSAIYMDKIIKTSKNTKLNSTFPIINFSRYNVNIIKMISVVLLFLIISLSAYRFVRDVMIIWMIEMGIGYYYLETKKAKLRLILFVVFTNLFYLYYSIYFAGIEEHTINLMFNGSIYNLFI